MTKHYYLINKHIVNTKSMSNRGGFEIFFFSADGKIDKTFVKHIEITSRLVSAYDFYSRVVKNHKRTSKVRASERFFTTSE